MPSTCCASQRRAPERGPATRSTYVSDVSEERLGQPFAQCGIVSTITRKPARTPI